MIGNIIKTDRLIQVRPSPGQRKTVSVMVAPVHNVMINSAKLVMMFGKVGRRIYRLLHIPRGKSLGFCHLHIIFAGIDQEKRAVVIDAEEE